ncbi:MAG: DUF6320 domain-containing protein [Bilifractor sp.]|jgi:hypothetical protein
MQYCEKCKVTIRGNKRCCPLCGGRLSGTAEPETAGYPVLKAKKVTKMGIVRVSLFCFLALEVVMTMLQIMLPGYLPWVTFVMIGAPVGWVDLVLAFYLRNNVIQLVTVQTYVGMIIGVVIDRMTGHPGWAVEWMIPSCFLGLSVITIIIGKVIQKRLLVEYVVYLAVDMALSLLQIVFIRIGWNKFIWPAVICITIMVIMALGALIFYHRIVRSAAGRVFHV